MNILEKIVADKRLEVKSRMEQRPLASFIDQLTPSDRNFRRALLNDKTSKGAAYILECKKASPSKGLIRPHFDLNEICEAYRDYASCVSVLTDEAYFQGAFERIPMVKTQLQQPVLCKDFIVSEYQINLARLFGANAVLLMLSILDDQEYRFLSARAKALKMDVLTEVSNADEMRRGIALDADIIGINNRNLRDLSTDLAQTPKLVALFRQLASPEQEKQTLLISESGITHRGQTVRLNTHVDGYLVGSSLMAQDSLHHACRALMEGEHKVCGLTQGKDAIHASRCGATFGGLIFVDSSKRKVTINQAKQIIEQTHAVAPLKFVAVVQDMSLSEILNLVQSLELSAIQLHGKESQADIDALRLSLKDCNKQMEIWKVVGVTLDGVLSTTIPRADRILLDTKTTSATGGTGISFNWSGLAKLPLSAPPIMLAGGLTPTNVTNAIQQPVAGLDLNSGVESQPGIKDHALINRAFQALLTQLPINKDKVTL